MRFPHANRNEWHKWFAWHPVRLLGATVWLERIYRGWNPEMYLSVIHPDDRGEHEGGWEYMACDRNPKDTP